MKDIDYAELKNLAENHMELYEKKRQEILNSFIDSFSSDTLKEHLYNVHITFKRRSMIKRFIIDNQPN